MGRIVTLKDRNSLNEIYPHTISQAVYHRGQPIVEVLDQVTKNKQDISELRDANTWKRYIPSN